MSIQELRPADECDLAQALAEAFLENPLNRAVIGGNPRARLRANRAGMDLTLGSARGTARVLTVFAEPGELAGGLIAVPPSIMDPVQGVNADGPESSRVSGITVLTEDWQ